MIKRLAYAKINLFLDIEGIAENGYHNIVSVMQSIDWADCVSVSSVPGGGISVSCSNEALPVDERNIAYRAARLFLSESKIDSGVQIHIEKRIPLEAGLAGGSADAAAVLLGMNDLFASPFSQDELTQMGAKIGADVPFCLVGGTQKATGIGQILDPIEPMPPCYIVCAKMGAGVSTPAAYRALDEKFDRFRQYSPEYNKLDLLRRAFIEKDIALLKNGCFNIFETVIEDSHSSVKQLKQALLSQGADSVMMSGSGPSVFGVFTDRKDAYAACLTLQNMGANASICRPCSCGGRILE